MHRAHFDVVADVDQRHWWFLARRRIVRDVLTSLLPPDANTIIIDVGCGAGANIAALAGEYRCIGIDTASDAIDIARKRFPQVEFMCGRAPDDLGATAGDASAMLLMDVLEHVENDRAAFEPLVKALRPGAFMLVTVPADMRLWSRHDEGLLHFRRYDEAMFRTLWRGLPVETLAVTHFCSRLYPVARVGRTLGRWRDRMLPASREWNMRVPPGPVNALMERAFEGESRMVCDLVRGRRHAGYSRGVSLLAVLRRTNDPRQQLNGA
jgi:SAM-dependent methyltransferase